LNFSRERNIVIALLCSVQAEAELLLAQTSAARIVTCGSKSIIEGVLAGQQVLLCVAGMGKVNAAHAATLLFSRFKPDAIIIFGIGGAYPSSGAQVGDIAIAKEEIAGDEGVMTLDGFKDTEYIGIPLIKTATSMMYTKYPASESLLKLSLQALASYQDAAAAKVHIGAFVTLSTCTGTSARAQELERRYHGLCENMEGAAAAQVSELHGMPWIEVRGISNIVEDRNIEKWNVPKAAETAQRAVVHILDFFQKIKQNGLSNNQS
jgi:futalosine hydrolase